MRSQQTTKAAFEIAQKSSELLNERQGRCVIDHIDQHRMFTYFKRTNSVPESLSIKLYHHNV